MMKYLKSISLVSISLLILIPINSFAVEDKIEHLESFRTCAYKDAGKWAVGFGQQFINGKRVVKGQCITYEEALLQLNDKLIKINKQLDKWLKANNTSLNKNQRDAMILFIYNIGWSGFLNSSIPWALEYDKSQVPIRLMSYVSVKGKVLNGLKERRAYEAKLFKGIK